MKISAYHKERGDIVGFKVGDPDIIYASVIFTKNRHKVDGLKFFYPKSKIEIGGSGYDLTKKLPPEIEFIKPDYDLYQCDYAMGYTSRGCNRSCHFCVVPKKEGKFQRWQHPSEFYYDRFDKIMFLDNNILWDKEWFKEVSNFCFEYSLKVWYTQGFDIRLLDETTLKIISDLKHYKMIEFAWDNVNDEKIILEKIKLLKEYFTDRELRSKIQFYVYVNDDSEFESGLYRCNKLKELGVNAFVMFNQEAKRTQRIKNLQRWANRKRIFWKINFEDYDPTSRTRY